MRPIRLVYVQKKPEFLSRNSFYLASSKKRRKTATRLLLSQFRTLFSLECCFVFVIPRQDSTTFAQEIDHNRSFSFCHNLNEDLLLKARMTHPTRRRPNSNEKMMSPMYPSDFRVTFPFPRCSVCKKEADSRELILVHAKEWKDCRSGVSSPVVCTSCLVGYNIPVVRPSTSTWEFGKVLSCWDSSTTFQTGNVLQQVDQHLVEFYDQTKEWVFVENDPYDAYVRHFDKIFPLVNEDDSSWQKSMIGTSPSMDQNEIHSLEPHSVNEFHSLDSFTAHQLSPIKHHPQKEYVSTSTRRTDKSTSMIVRSGAQMN